MIDSHCHFDFDAFDGQRPQLLEQCVIRGIEAIVVPGICPDQWRDLATLVMAHDSPCRLYATAGLHPWWVKKLDLSLETFKVELDRQLQLGSCVAIGECGLDGVMGCSLPRQQAFFDIHLQLACDHQLPLILHGHKAHSEVLRLLTQYRPAAGGVIHGFAGSSELAQQYWRLGFSIGVGGTITYKRAQKTRRAIQALPLEALLLETDAPDMPLSGCQGQPSSPLQLPHVAQSLADLRGESLLQVRRQTAHNSRQLFSLN